MGTVQQSNFNGGELSESLYGRTDLEKYDSSVKTMDNFIPMLQGNVMNRPGTEYICETKDSGIARLIPFQFSVTQSYVIEFGDFYIRFITDGGQILDGVTPLEYVSPYAEADLNRIQYAQSADVLFLVHPDYPPHELKRFSNTNWSISAIVFGSNATTPSSVVSDNAGSAFSYQVTSIVDGEESTAGTGTSLTEVSTMSWGSVGNADSYNIYKSLNGVYGWIATSTSASFKDASIIPDTTKTPPIGGNPFSSDAALISLGSNIIPVMSGSGVNASGGGWSASVTSYIDSRYQLYRAFTGNTYDEFGWAANTGTDQTLEIDPAGSVQVSGYRITSNGNAANPSCISAWTFQGFDGTWHILDTRSGEINWSDTESRVYSFYNETSYSKYKFVITAGYSNPNIPDIADIQFYTGTYSGEKRYPGSVTIHQQRLVFARTDAKPQTFFGSQTGNFYNFNTSSPLQDDDSYEYTINSNQVNEIQWLSAIRSMLASTSGAEYEITAASSGGPITPTSINVLAQGNRGSQPTIPIIIGSSLIFITRSGNKVRDYGYSFDVDGYTGDDITILANHLFKKRTIVEWAFHNNPYATVWVVCDDGKLLGLIYDKNQKVVGWSQHTTDGNFESVAVIAGSE